LKEEVTVPSISELTDRASSLLARSEAASVNRSTVQPCHDALVAGSAALVALEHAEVAINRHAPRRDFADIGRVLCQLGACVTTAESLDIPPAELLALDNETAQLAEDVRQMVSAFP
jgi:hypothetical protein